VAIRITWQVSAGFLASLSSIVVAGFSALALAESVHVLARATRTRWWVWGDN